MPQLKIEFSENFKIEGNKFFLIKMVESFTKTQHVTKCRYKHRQWNFCIKKTHKICQGRKVKNISFHQSYGNASRKIPKKSSLATDKGEIPTIELENFETHNDSFN